MSGLEVAAGVIGITDVACKSLINLYRFVKDIQDAPELVQQIGKDISTLDKCLDATVDIVKDAGPDLIDMLHKSGLPGAINECASPCDQLRKDLERWTKSKGGSQALWSKIQVRAHKGRIEATLARIETAKSTVDLVTDTATLYLVSRTFSQHHDLETNLHRKLDTLAPAIREKLSLANSKSHSLRLLFNENDTPENENALLEAEKEKAAYEQLWANYTVLSRLTQQIGDVDSGESANVTVGMPQDVVEKVKQQTIGNVKSGANAEVKVGVF